MDDEGEEEFVAMVLVAFPEIGTAELGIDMSEAVESWDAIDIADSAGVSEV